MQKYATRLNLLKDLNFKIDITRYAQVIAAFLSIKKSASIGR